MQPNRLGNCGWYFRVLNCAAEKGLSFEVWGLPCDLVTPRSASRKAVALAFMGPPRSACSVSCPGGTACLANVSSNRVLNRAVSSTSATHQPTTRRLKMSRMTCREKYDPLDGPISLVISHEQTWLEASASNSGFW